MATTKRRVINTSLTAQSKAQPLQEFMESGRDGVSAQSTTPLQDRLDIVEQQVQDLHSGLGQLFAELRPYVADYHFNADDEKSEAAEGQALSSSNTPTFNKVLTISADLENALNRLNWIRSQIQH
jgi:hypothetical protein